MVSLRADVALCNCLHNLPRWHCLPGYSCGRHRVLDAFTITNYDLRFVLMLRLFAVFSVTALTRWLSLQPSSAVTVNQSCPHLAAPACKQSFAAFIWLMSFKKELNSLRYGVKFREYLTAKMWLRSYSNYWWLDMWSWLFILASETFCGSKDKQMELLPDS